MGDGACTKLTRSMGDPRGTELEKSLNGSSKEGKMEEG